MEKQKYKAFFPENPGILPGVASAPLSLCYRQRCSDNPVSKRRNLPLHSPLYLTVHSLNDHLHTV